MKRPLLILGLVLLSGCSFLRGKSGGTQRGGLARPATTFQSTHYTIEEASPGRYKCAPKGVLADLEAGGCFGDMAGCKHGLDAVTGKLGSDYERLFADTLSRTDNAFAYQCIGLSRPASGPENLHNVGLVGLALLNDASSIDRVIALDVPAQRDSEWHKAMRGNLAFALWQSQNTEKALPKLIELAQLTDTDAQQRAAMVLYVGRWESNGLVDMCAKELAEPSSDAVAQACAWYIPHVKAPDAIAMLAKADARLGTTQVRALGWTGDTKAADAINKITGTTPTDAQRVASKVALLNVGKKDALKDVVAALGGTLSGKRSADGKLGADELSLEAAQEVLALSNRTFDKDIIKALQKLTSSKNEQTAMAAWIALAYLKDASAIENLTAVLAGADDSMRKFILENTGALADGPGRRYTTGSYGVLANKQYAASIAATFSSASTDNAGRAQAVRTIAAINTATRGAE